MEVVTYRRDELYEEVWSRPATEVARKYRVSGVALGKICERLGVPVPGRGYWARVAAGQKPARPPLPCPKPGQASELRVRRRRTDEDLITQATAGRRPTQQIKVSSDLLGAHELVVRSAAVLGKARVSDDGFLCCNDKSCLAIRVAPKSLDRALRIMTALLKAFDANGTTVHVTQPRDLRVWTPSVTMIQKKMPLTLVEVEGEWVPIALEELVDTKDLRKTDPEAWRRALNRYERRPNGRLCLRIVEELDEYKFRAAIRRRWADGETRRLEQCLSAFVDALPVAALAIKKERERAEEQRKKNEEFDRAYREKRERAELLKNRPAELEKELAARRLARQIREYVDEARAIVASGGLSIVEGGDLDVWLKWCESYAVEHDSWAWLRKEVTETVARKTKPKAPND
jgi:hypothetical protein